MVCKNTTHNLFNIDDIFNLYNRSYQKGKVKMSERHPQDNPLWSEDLENYYKFVNKCILCGRYFGSDVIQLTRCPICNSRLQGESSILEGLEYNKRKDKLSANKVTAGDGGSPSS